MSCKVRNKKQETLWIVTVMMICPTLVFFENCGGIFRIFHSRIFMIKFFAKLAEIC